MSNSSKGPRAEPQLCKGRSDDITVAGEVNEGIQLPGRLHVPNAGSPHQSKHNGRQYVRFVQ